LTDIVITQNPAGALPSLVAMVDNSNSPMIRESAAAAIAKLVSCHPVKPSSSCKMWRCEGYGEHGQMIRYICEWACQWK